MPCLVKLFSIVLEGNLNFISNFLLNSQFHSKKKKELSIGSLYPYWVSILHLICILYKKKNQFEENLPKNSIEHRHCKKGPIKKCLKPS